MDASAALPQRASESPDAPRATARERVPLSVVLSFAAPSFAGAAMAIPIGVLMPKFYSDVVLAPLGSVALAIAIARSFDALTDPVMGWLTDRTHSRWGRRKPWIALGVPLAAVAFWALFSPPSHLQPGGAALWFGACFTLYFLFSTIFEVPHGALGAEISLDYHERSRLFAVRAFFIQPGTIFAAAAPVLLLSIYGAQHQREIYSGLAAVIAVLLVALYGLLLWRVPERREFVRRRSNPLVPGVRRALRNRPFRILFLAGLTNAIPAAIPAVLLPYLVQYVLQPANPELWLAILLGTFLTVGMLFVPVWIWLSRRVGKLATFLTAASIGTLASVLFFFIGPGRELYALAVFALAGTQSAVGIFLLPAMGADTIDYDELLTGKRREAQFNSFWAIVPKFVSIPGSSIPIAALAAVGYVPNEAQSEPVIFAIRFLVALFPAGFYVTALLILTRYPISEQVHAAIRAGIEAHQRGAPAPDPLTGRVLPPPSQRGIDEATGWFLDYFSAGELRRCLAGGMAGVRLDVARAAAVSLLACGGAVGIALTTLGGLRAEPGLLTVLSVVGAGLAVTAFLFHALRWRPALRLARGDVEAETLRAHLASLGPQPADS